MRKGYTAKRYAKISLYRWSHRSQLSNRRSYSARQIRERRIKPDIYIYIYIYVPFQLNGTRHKTNPRNTFTVPYATHLCALWKNNLKLKGWELDTAAFDCLPVARRFLHRDREGEYVSWSCGVKLGKPAAMLDVNLSVASAILTSTDPLYETKQPIMSTLPPLCTEFCLRPFRS
ncbi:hypothetical protein BDV30DRAFT_85008 [Aspergillus minisclerotigenes]|uniref:Uncharacterized protein n=1 Tax=Aspergillus minisclerotigenes TaxID=656917 RepID=A0A5N6J8E5_9EURO|nr:hypothetical protein BDV30DRAFT_85008 [Aspergillus minisclerotigenes]